VSGAALLGLQDEVDSSVIEGGAHTTGFVADDDENVVGRNDARRGSDYVSQQRPARDFVKDFGELRFKARAFPGSHDGEGDAGGSRSRFRHFSNYTLWRKSSEERMVSVVVRLANGVAIFCGRE
jgi:hypothetical protein